MVSARLVATVLMASAAFSRQAQTDSIFICFCMRGELDLANPPNRERIREGTLVVIPPKGSVTLQASGPAGAALAEFIPQRR